MNYLKELENKIKSNQFTISIVGVGYIGENILNSMIRSGVSKYIKLYDVNVEKLNDKIQYLNKITTDKDLEISNNPEILVNSDIIIICVPTPLIKNTVTPDLSMIESACDNAMSYCSKGTLIIVESTVYPNFTEHYLVNGLIDKGFKVGEDIFVSYSSERINPGDERDLHNIPKVVSGHTINCKYISSAFYSLFIECIIEADTLLEAELSKLLENTYRFINIAFINEFYQQCEIMGANVSNVIELASSKPYGFHKFNPGMGPGGHCIPVDPFYLKYALEQVGQSTCFIDLSESINKSMVLFNINKLVTALKQIELTRVHIIGVTYKENVSDIRESTAIFLIKELLSMNIIVSYYDPYIPFLKIDNYELTSKNYSYKEMNNFSAIIIHTPHDIVNYSELSKTKTYIFNIKK